MQELTALPLAIGALMLGRGEIRLPGVVAPEDCIDPGPFLVELEKRGVSVVDMTGQWPDEAVPQAGSTLLGVALAGLGIWWLLSRLRRHDSR